MLCKPPAPNPQLEALLRVAASHKMTREEIQEQRVSFVYGQLMNCAPDVTKEDIRRRLLGTP